MNANNQNDKAYFDALYSELELEGPAAMLADLLAFDFSQVNLRKPPLTPLLLEQIANHLSQEDRWFWSVLSEGEFYDGIGRTVGADGKAGLPARLRSNGRWFSRRSQRRFVAMVAALFHLEIAVGRYLKKIIPGLKVTRPYSPVGERPRCFVLPALAELRAAFTIYCGVKFDDDVSSADHASRSSAEFDSSSSADEWPPIDAMPVSDDPFYMIGREMQIEFDACDAATR